MRRQLTYILLTLSILSGCASVQVSKHIVDLSKDVQYRLSPASSQPHAIVATQKITTNYGGRPFILFSHIELDRSHLAMIGTTATGNTLFSLSFLQDELSISNAPWMPKTINVLNVLADFQLIFWPRKAILQGLNTNEVQIVDNPLTKTRTLNYNGTVVAEIKYQYEDPWRGKVHFKNNIWDYAYTIETLELQRQKSLPNNI